MPVAIEAITVGICAYGAAVGVVDKIYDEQNKKWDDGTAAQKLQYYAISIFMGERAYDLLVRMGR